MIKKLTLLITLLMVVGCSSQPNVSSSPSATLPPSGSSSFQTDSSTDDIFDPKKVASQIKLAEYEYVDSLGTNWVFITAINESKWDVQLTFDIQFKDETGAVIGVASNTVNVFDSGHQTMLSYKSDDKYATYSFGASLQSDTLFPARLDEFTYDANILLEQKKVIVSVTNNSEVVQKALEYEALFFLNGQVVDKAWGYVKDGNYEIQPKTVRSQEITSFETFDDVKVFYYS